MMLLRSVLPTLLFALFALPAVGGGESDEPAVDPCVRAAVEAIQKRYESVRDLEARFQQTSHSVALGRSGSSSVSSGSVVIAKPGRMRWHYLEPEESLVVSDGRWMWIYDAAKREAQKLEVGEAWLSGAAVQFLLGEGEVLRDFEASADSCGEEEALLVLVPRKPATYEKLKLRADPRTGDVSETEVHDLLGNVTRITLRDLQTNTSPAPELFTFRAPEGVKILELPAAPGSAAK